MTDAEIKQGCIEHWARIPASEEDMLNCAGCGDTIAYTAFLELPEAEREGWYLLCHRNGVIRTCAEHKKPRFPWAADLDPGKVRLWLAEMDAIHKGHAYFLDFDDLRERCMP